MVLFINGYQKNIIDSEMANTSTAISNIGGLIAFNTAVTYEEIFVTAHEIIKSTPELRLRLNSKNELYECEYKKEDYDVPYIKINGDYDKVAEYMSSVMKTPFANIYDTSLFEIACIEYDDGCAGTLKLHHVLGDAVSVIVVCSKAEKCIKQLKSGAEPCCDYVKTVYPTMSEKVLARAREYFDDKLNGVEPGRLTNKMTEDCSADIYSLSMPRGENGIAELFAALAVYISNITDSNKVAIGDVLGNRRKNEFGMFGMFANQVPLVLEPGTEDETFSELCDRVNRELFLLLRYSAYSAVELKKYNNVNERLFDISVSYKINKFIPKMETAEVIEFDNGCLDMPVRIFADEYSDKLKLDIHYRTALFSKQQIENMGNAILKIINTPKDKKISDISCLTEYDNGMYAKLNNTETEHKYNDVTECFKQNISHRDAVVFEDEKIDGFELDERSELVALYAEEKGAKLVGIKMQRCIEMMVAVIGTLKAGAAFVYLTDDMKAVEEKCDLVLTQEYVIKLCSTHNKSVIFKERTYDPSSIAYLICTSGSAGTPKCIEISRKSLMSRLEWADRRFGLRGTVLQKTVNTFDVSVWEVMSVIFGAKVCLLKSGCEKMPNELAAAIQSYGVDTIHFVPSMLNVFLRYVSINNIDIKLLKKVFSSGERLETDTVKTFYAVCDKQNITDVRLYNLYGPSECTIDVTGYECVKTGTDDVFKTLEEIPIGTPADNTQIYILNNKLKRLPVGCCGEICILGELVGNGYTDKISRGYIELGGKRAYLTGDVGKLGFDGELYIYDRKDRQVKIRGMRIDLSEVRGVVLTDEGVTDAVVVKNGERLECFYCGNCNVDKVKSRIAEQVQVYAVPSVFHKLSEIPLTASGKTDVQGLLATAHNDTTEPFGDKFSYARSNIESLIARAVAKYVKVNPDENMFAAGLDSLSVLEVVCELQECGADVSFGDFYEGLSVRKTAEISENKRYTVWLKKENKKGLLVAFPYGGGEPQFFEKVAKELSCDVVGVYVSAFDKACSVENIAKKIYSKIDFNKYERIYIYGHCIGTMVATELAKLLDDRLNGLILAAAATSGSVPVIGSPWNMLNNSVIAKILELADDGSIIVTEKVIKKFKKDTDRYFGYVSQKREPITLDCEVDVIFGTADPFTANSKKVIKDLKRYILNDCRVHSIDGAKHFFTNTHIKELSEIINGIVNV